MSELIVGIDLGTTNSEVAAYVDGRVRVLGPDEDKMLPSCVGLSPDGKLLTGKPARNQQLVYPERTVRSVKRKMGGLENVTLGDKVLSPQEISALILRELAEWASSELGEPVRHAVITVPAYFSDAQRTATREAGMMAGLEVVRILNEPTAASLAYGFGDSARRTVMIYDLGGGTFDVSIVTIEGDLTEVLASHGNNQLGGDDFDDLLLKRLEREFHQQHGFWLNDNHRAARARLWWAAEAAKKRLSSEPHVKVREESLVGQDGKPLHLEVEISRLEYERMILPLVESTLDSVSKALDDAGKKPGDVDSILLVGGSTRTPLVSRLLQERTGLEPRQEVHPDLCVSLGAGVLASRLAGHDVDRVLVDVSPYSFGPSYLGERGGAPYPHCYKPIIRRNTPLPVTRTERYFTSHYQQTEVQVEVFQGDDEDALRNILVGEFLIEGLTPMDDANEVLCRMDLDLDGILHVTAIEKRTGKSKQITISNALQAKSEAEIASARKRVEDLYASRESPGEDYEDDDEDDIQPELAGVSAGEMETQSGSDSQEPGNVSGDGISMDSPEWTATRHSAVEAIQRSRRVQDSMHVEDKKEALKLQAEIESAVARRDSDGLHAAVTKLEELLFFVESA